MVKKLHCAGIFSELPWFLWLKSELKGEIIEPNFYFKSKEKHPKKDQLLALDYLLMTQGWRRFEWTKTSETIANFKFKSQKTTISGHIFNEFQELKIGH